MFLDCPAYTDHECTARCGLPAEVICRFTMNSTDGPLDSAKIRCPAGHWFNAPIEFLTWEDADGHQPVTAETLTVRTTAAAFGHDSRSRWQAG